MLQGHLFLARDPQAQLPQDPKAPIDPNLTHLSLPSLPRPQAIPLPPTLIALIFTCIIHEERIREYGSTSPSMSQ
jgi:hypothetical protein